MRTTLRKPTQHFGTKHEASVLSKARSLAVDRDRKVPKRHATNMEEADEWGHALETWSDATTPYWVGRKSQFPLSGKFATFRMRPVLGETFIPLRCVILEAISN